jgi:hypothetical protein
VTESGDDESVAEVNRERLAEGQNVNRADFAEGQPQNRQTCVES